MILKPLHVDFSVCQVADYSQTDLTGTYCFIGKTDEENSLVCPSAGPRLRDVIETALCDLPVRNAQGDLRGARILFALDAGSAGMDEPTLRLLRRLRSEPGCLEGSVCGFVVDGETELYTKALAQDLALAANLAGALPDHVPRSLVHR